ncbi:hypothetical protein CY35_15G061300 [Sphagnum magellanicum]|nr:hypothetical protein CY35_15G061300 [Sphagnum magellanicum]KAH9539522.1 hypothetical protein CY35_15G061300 [Sphagnum magellanicum]
MLSMAQALDGVLDVLEMSPSSSAVSHATGVAVGVAITAVAGVAVAVAVGGLIYYNDGTLPFVPTWPGRRHHDPLTAEKWSAAFEPEEGQLLDGGSEVIYKVRKGGIEPSIRALVWPFLLGVYDLDSNCMERDVVKSCKKKEYEALRQQCCQICESLVKKSEEKQAGADQESPVENSDTRLPFVGEEDERPLTEVLPLEGGELVGLQNGSSRTAGDSPAESSSSPVVSEKVSEIDVNSISKGKEIDAQAVEDFKNWQRIIRLDAVRMNAEWIPYAESQANVTVAEAALLAQQAGLMDDEHLEPSRRHHAARLVLILEAYTLFDPETGYCQGMSDLLSPFVALIDDDFEAFWCFVKFMEVARHNFRLDEVGIRRQLNLVSSILKASDPQLYQHLAHIRSEDCTFVYRMVVVLMRRELSFEQTLCLWEVMWADWAALASQRGLSDGRRTRDRLGPPSRDLLLYTIAAAVRKRRKFILGNCSGMDELVRECNGMAGNLDIWDLLHGARELVYSVHDEVSK